jgi:peptidoglycan/LPS O-acetylase OafA/YrhL
MGTVWTLKYESLCYLGVLAAGLVGLLDRRRLVLVLWIALVVAVMLREVLAPDGSKGVETALRLPLIFLTGGLIYLWREHVPLSLGGLAVGTLLAVLLGPTPLYKAALFLVTAWGIFVLALHPALTRSGFEPTADLSYGVYLYGWPVQQTLYALFPALSAAILLAPALVLTLLVAMLSWYGVEKPALDLKRRLLRPRRPAC